MSKANIGLFGDGWQTTPAEGAFLRYLSPIYRRASKEGKKTIFFVLLWPVWFDRFPVVLLDGWDDDDPSLKGGVDPDRLEWAKGLQKQYIQTKLYWEGANHGKDFEDEKYNKWEEQLTVDADRARRRHDYFSWARLGVYGQGHEFDIVITLEERAAMEKTPEEWLLYHCDRIENEMWPYARLLDTRSDTLAM